MYKSYVQCSPGVEFSIKQNENRANIRISSVIHFYKRPKVFFGDNAGIQPGNLQEVMLHETSVAWIRRRETVTQTREPWTETVEAFGIRLKGICQYINDNYEVEDLCRELPERIQEVIDEDGDRISK